MGPGAWSRLTPENRPVVARYLRRSRLLPVCGAIVAVVLATLVELVLHGELVILGFHSDGSVAPCTGPFQLYIGYLLGALCAEISMVRARDPARRAASLVPRELVDYLPRRLLLAQRALGVAVVLGVIVMGLVPYSVARVGAQLAGARDRRRLLSPPSPPGWS